MFEAEKLRALARGPATLAPALSPYLEKWAAPGGIDTPLRRAHFLAQCCHECGFARLTENLNYSAEGIARVFPHLAPRAVELAHRPEALANAAYAGRFGNGDEASGDGWRYRGRGLLQLTFRDNYRHFHDEIGVALETSPDLAAEPEIAVRVAIAYWQERGCNEAADRDDVEAVTRKINGGLNGLAERKTLTQRAKEIFSGAPLIA